MDESPLQRVLPLLRKGWLGDAIQVVQQSRKDYQEAARRTSEAVLKQLLQGKKDQGLESTAPQREYLRTLEPDFASEELVRKARSVGVELEGFSSFRRCLAVRSRSRSVSRLSQEWALNGKSTGRRFAGLLSVDCPQIHRSMVSVDELEKSPLERVVVKPINGAGAQGVFLVFAANRIFDLRKRKWLNSWCRMIAAMRDRLNQGVIGKDHWSVEELILEDVKEERAGRDLKFYCFYGRVELVIEIRRLDNRVVYCEWDGEGNRVFSGKYDHRRFEGVGVNREQLELAKSMSAKVPTPFMRIDFIKSEDAPVGMTFGEFTPRPGDFHKFSDETDRRLGDAFLDADARLLNDLVRHGKGFPEFRDVLAQRGKRSA